jgi:hypothetical protein
MKKTKKKNRFHFGAPVGQSEGDQEYNDTAVGTISGTSAKFLFRTAGVITVKRQ